MSSSIVSYGDFVFPAVQQDYRDNFSDGMPQSVTLPGRAGSYNQDGDGPLATQVGSASLGFKMIAASREDMTALRDELKRVQAFGLQKLVKQPSNPALPTRYCWAFIHYISDAERFDQHTDYWQNVTITFHIPDPHWYVDDVDVPKWDGTYQFNGAITFSNGAAVYACSGLETSIEIEHTGSGIFIPLITISTGASQTCQNPEIRRIVTGQVVDRVRYTGTLGNSKILSIDAPRQAVELGGVNVMGANVGYEHPALMRLQPGYNTIKVRFKNVGDAATLRVWMKEVYK